MNLSSLASVPRAAHLSSRKSNAARPATARVIAPRGSRKPAAGVVFASDLVDISKIDMSKLDCLDEEAMLKESAFPIPPEDLILRTKAFIATGGGLEMDEIFAPTFEFCAPVVGPIPKDQYVAALSSFELTTGFPDLQQNNHHFRVDPLEPNRVWYTSKTRGTHTGVLAGAIQPTGIYVDGVPQTNSVKFNERGQVTQFTIGYPMDRRVGNTGGLGGVFGIFYAIGKPLPFPEGNPWKMSKRYKAFTLFSNIAAKFRKK